MNDNNNEDNNSDFEIVEVPKPDYLCTDYGTINKEVFFFQVIFKRK
jgi:hypothetical protein